MSLSASQIVQLWHTALEQLDQLSNHQQQQPNASAEQRVWMLSAALQFWPLPNVDWAVWSQLVAPQLKAPYKLGLAAADALRRGEPLCPRGAAAITGLQILLGKAYHDHVLLGSESSAFANAVGQQLQRSAFLAALPGLLDAAAAALAALQHRPHFADVPHSMQQAADLPPQTPAAATTCMHVFFMRDVGEALLWLVAYVLALWPRLCDRTALALPALRLCAAAMQHCSRCADLIPSDRLASTPPPTVLEQLMAAALTAGHAVGSAWDLQGGEEYDSCMWESPDVIRVLSMLLMVAAVCPESSWRERPELLHSRRDLGAAARSTLKSMREAVRRTGELAPGSESALAASWQFACAHASDLTDIQQQALRELGCGSGRMFMFVSGGSISWLMNTNTVLALTGMLSQVIKHRAVFPQLDSPVQSQRFAKALAHLKPGEQPPSGSSPMLSCAPLLWLMPAVLLQWAARQPADGPHSAYTYKTLSHLIWESLEQVGHQLECWRCAELTFFAAAGGWEDIHARQQAMFDSARDTLLLGPPCPIFVTFGMPDPTPEQAVYRGASKAAAGFRQAWTPPAPCLAQLLRLAADAGDCVMSGLQAALVAAAQEAPPAASSSSSGAGGGSRSRSVGGGSSCSSEGCGGRSSAATNDGPSFRASVLFSLTRALPVLLEVSARCLWDITHKDLVASRHDSTGMIELQRFGVGWPAQAPVTRLNRQEQAGLEALCAALQDTLPQLCSLLEAALRSSVGSEANCALASTGGRFLSALQVPGLLVASDLLPGSPSLRPVCGVAFTLLKLVGSCLAPGSCECAQEAAVETLWTVLDFVSVFLEAADASTSSSGASSSSSSRGHSTGEDSSSIGSAEALFEALKSSNVAKAQDAPWSVEALSTVSTAGSSSSSSNAGLGHPHSPPSSSRATLSLVPWLVCMGRCCLGYASALQLFGTTSDMGMDGLEGAFERASKLLQRCLHIGRLLYSSSVSAQLSAAGYAIKPLLEPLQAAVAAHTCAAPAAIRAQLLQELGLVLSSMPVSTTCNHPLCSSLTGLSEQQLVVGTSRKCSGCLVARYCCREHQVAHWKHHKPACKAMAAAAAAKTPNAAV